MKSLSLGLALTALVTLMTELVLTRVFDTILTANMSYMVITCTMFGFGLAGVYAALRPDPPGTDVRRYLSLLTLGMAIAMLLFLPVINRLPFDYREIGETPLRELTYFVLIYFALLLPFFLSGLVFTTVFSAFPRHIRRLYFWDLAGAAVGTVILVPFLPPIGPGGLLFCGAGLALFASALFSGSRSWAIATSVAAVAVAAIPFARMPEYIEFEAHMASDWLRYAKDEGRLEYVRWDPLAKIEVVDWEGKKRVVYDGGGQLSWIYPFDGDFDALRAGIGEDVDEHFWQLDALASHYLKRDSDQRVLIIGGGAGQETKAALMYGAAHVDVVELVGAVIDLVRTRYAEYGGHLYQHPRVETYVAEARSALRHSDRKYDIIQMFSNHTSSAIASGTGAMATTYLQTAEAYREYFEHLTENGVLQVNHPLYPRMIATAALAWRQMGRTDFRRHVVVFENPAIFQPSYFVKMQPWTQAEVDELRDLFATSGSDAYTLVEDPLHPEESFLSDAFYSGDPALLAPIAAEMDYRTMPCTDDRPYFRFWRNQLGSVDVDDSRFLNVSTARMLNRQITNSLPMDVIHLFVTGVVSLAFVFVFVFVPLWFSKVGRERWPGRGRSMAYFSCLGAGFIIFELVFIQIFMQFIGSPLYAYSTVIFSMLLSAALGSLSSEKLEIGPDHRWRWPFVGVLVSTLGLVLLHGPIFDALMGLPQYGRIGVAALLIFPSGFFLGMPFPLGILRLEGRPTGAIAWAWGLNGLFTVVGGLASIVLSLFVGFTVTLLCAVSIYGLAFWLFAQDAVERVADRAPARAAA